jgi:PKD repeat protein
MNILGKLLTTTILCMLAIHLSGQSLSYKKSVIIEADVQDNPPAITLKWNQDFSSLGYKVFKRLFGSTEWNEAIAELPINSASFTDILVGNNTVYEYKIEKETIFGTAYGYACSAVNFQGFEYKGKMLLFVEESLLDLIPEAIDQYKLDLSLNGWKPVVLPTSKTATHFEIKEIINTNLEDNTNDMILLLGDIAVPYSGNINPDGIPQHKGAWPCDGYYGELDGTWTDNIVFTILNEERNHNIPNDGKFDQSEFPNDVEIPVGRINFSKLATSEVEYASWTANYLNKLHDYKVGLFYPNKGCVIQDELFAFVEAYAQNAWKNAGPIVGISNIEEGLYYDSILEDSYFLAYANGTCTFDSCENVISTEQFKTDSLNSVISILYGSYLGDWDSQNNLLMAALINGNSLASIWAGRPNWQIHSLGIGFPIGTSLVNIQNNIALNYNSGIASKGVHISLLGDPTLEAHPAKPITGVQVEYSDGSGILNWNPYPEEDILAYHIYELVDYELIPVATLNPNTTNFNVECLEYNTPKTFVIRASFTQYSKSGSFVNHSIGTPIELMNQEIDWTTIAQFTYSQFGGTISFTNNSENAQEYQWYIDGELVSTETEFDYLGTINSTINVQLISSNECASDTIEQSILITSTKDLSLQNSWSVYPNPTQEDIFIQNLPSNSFLEIIGTDGKSYYKNKVTEGNVSIPRSSFKSGIYIIRVDLDTAISTQKLIIL